MIIIIITLSDQQIDIIEQDNELDIRGSVAKDKPLYAFDEGLVNIVSTGQEKKNAKYYKHLIPWTLGKMNPNLASKPKLLKTLFEKKNLKLTRDWWDASPFFLFTIGDASKEGGGGAALRGRG